MAIEKMNQANLVGGPNASLRNLNRPEIMKQDPQNNTEEMEKKIGQDLEAAAALGKSLVKSILQTSGSDFEKIAVPINDKVEAYDEALIKGENSFKNIEDFKNAGGSFDKYGRAVLNGKTFTGIIRTKYDEEYPEGAFGARYNARQYANFSNDGYLSEVLTVDKDWKGVTLDKVAVHNPYSSVANYEIATQKFSIKDCRNKGYEVLLENYGIS